MQIHSKKIVIVTSYAKSLIDFRLNLIIDLMARGARVVALAPDVDGNTRYRLSALGVEVIDIRLSRAGMNPFMDIVSTYEVYKKLRLLKPDIVFAYFIKPVIFGLVAAWLAGVKRRIVMIEGLGYVFAYKTNDLSLGRQTLKAIVISLYYFALRFAHKVIFLNADDLREFVKMSLVDEIKSINIGGIGIDLDRWCSVPFVHGEQITFLMVARLLREKGVAEYAEAAERVKSKYPKTNFLLLGGLDDNPGTISLDVVSAWNNRGILTWYGHVPVAEHLRVTSVYVLPSYREGVPVSTMEAMAVGRPIITTDVPGCRETVVDGINGFMVPAKDAVRLAEKMIWFIENPSSIATMGAASRKMAEEKFDVHKINAKLMQIIFCDENEKIV